LPVQGAHAPWCGPGVGLPAGRCRADAHAGAWCAPCWRMGRSSLCLPCG